METQRVEVEPVRDNQSTFFGDVRCNSIHLLLDLQYITASEFYSKDRRCNVLFAIRFYLMPVEFLSVYKTFLVLTSTKHHQAHPFSFHASLHWKFKLLTSKYLNEIYF